MWDKWLGKCGGIPRFIMRAQKQKRYSSVAGSPLMAAVWPLTAIVQQEFTFVILYLTNTYVLEQRTAELYVKFLARFPKSINRVAYLLLRHYDVQINYSQADALNERKIFCGFIQRRKRIYSLFAGKQDRQCT
jgi:hypothetical protein